MIRWSKRGRLRRTQCVQYIAQESGRLFSIVVLAANLGFIFLTLSLLFKRILSQSFSHLIVVQCFAVAKRHCLFLRFCPHNTCSF